MKKWGQYIFLIAAILFLFCGCSNSESGQESGQGTDTPTEVKQYVGEIEVSPTDYEGKDYDFDTDYQSYFYLPYITKGDAGYYYWNTNDERMYYFDIAASQNVILCNKADCSHNDDDCCGYFNAGHEEDKDFFFRNYLQYYDGSVYVCGVDTKGNVSLYKVAADGSSRDRYMRLFRQNTLSPNGDSVFEFKNPEICIHRGYVYFINTMETIPKIYRMELGSDKQEVIYECDGLRPAVYRMKPYGDKIYFQSGNFTDDEYLDIEGGIYVYDTDTEKVSLYKESAIGSYLFYRDELYYAAADGIYHQDEQGTDEKVLDTEKGNADFMMINERVAVYLDEKYNMHVCDMEEGSEHTIGGEEIVNCLFGDGTFLFADGYDEGAESNIYIMKFEDLFTASGWTNLADYKNGD